MKITIFKYPLPTSKTKVSMPHSATILSVQLQHGIPCIWAMVDVDNDLEDREFWIFGTGHVLPDNPGIYIGTILDGSFVWHIFEKK